MKITRTLTAAEVESILLDQLVDGVGKVEFVVSQKFEDRPGSTHSKWILAQVNVVTEAQL